MRSELSDSEYDIENPRPRKRRIRRHRRRKRRSQGCRSSSSSEYLSRGSVCSENVAAPAAPVRKKSKSMKNVRCLFMLMGFWTIVAAMALCWFLHTRWDQTRASPSAQMVPFQALSAAVSKNGPNSPRMKAQVSRAPKMTYEEVVQRFENTPKLKGEISRGFLDLARDQQFCEAGGAALLKKFGKLTKEDTQRGALVHFEKMGFLIRMEDITWRGSPMSANMLNMAWRFGGKKLARDMTTDCIDPTNGWCETFTGQIDHLDLNKYIAIVRGCCFMVCLPGWSKQWTDLPDLMTLHVETLNAGKKFDYSMIQFPEHMTKRCPDLTFKFLLEKFGLGWVRRFIPAKDLAKYELRDM